jgi:hypothetical protein
MIEKLFDNESQGKIETKITLIFNNSPNLEIIWHNTFADFCHKLNGYEAILVETDHGSYVVIVSNIIYCRLPHV